jgi:hypothetical protein
MANKDVQIMDKLIDDLANMDKPWYSFLNIYENMKSSEATKQLFSNNWVLVFGSGLGLPHEQMWCMRDMYIDGYTVEEISKRRGIDETNVRNYINSHLQELMSPRAYILAEKTYLMQLSDMKKNRFNGYYDNYGVWHEPEYSAKRLYLNISLFNMIDKPFMEKFFKTNNITSIGALCTWIKEHISEIENRKAGVGVKTAEVLLGNVYVIRQCTDELPVLKKIAGV